ncbi:hypothetical protein FQ626_00855 [Erwinia pyrifoliae]|nr:hypothetical protein [Erwinia pyrifoliae]
MLTEDFCLRQNFFNTGHVCCFSSCVNQNVILSRLVQNAEFATVKAIFSCLLSNYSEDYISTGFLI